MLFSLRKDFKIQEDLTPDDYLKMKELNRQALKVFLQKLRDNKNFQSAMSKFEEIKSHRMGPPDASPNCNPAISSQDDSMRDQSMSTPKNESYLKSDSFGEMSPMKSPFKINRGNQYDFSSAHAAYEPFKRFPQIQSESFLDSCVTDLDLDQNIKAILQSKMNG